MSLIKGQFWGDSAGKVAGVVFGRGKGGKSIRAHVKGTDAKTEAQQQVRTGFTSTIGLWGTLTGAMKRAWNTFAATGFRSKNSKKGNTPSGFQAFAGTNFALKLANNAFNTSVFTPTTITATMSQLPPFNDTPPVSGFSTAIQTSAGDPLFLSLASAIFDITNSKIKFTLGFSPAPQASAPVFENPVTDEPVSFNVYCSAVIPPGRQTVNKMDAYLLGNTGTIGALTGWTSKSDLEFVQNLSSAYLGSIKTAFSVGNDVFVSVYAVSAKGQMSRLGIKRVTIV